MDAKDLLLDDAIATAIEGQRKATKQRAVIYMLSFIDLVLVGLVVALLIGGR